MPRQTQNTDDAAGRETPSSPVTPCAHGASRRWLWAVWLLSVGYLSFFVFRGWIPVDEGLLAQTAERVLLGELPHRDFDDCYTGGLAYLYAAAFWALGTKLACIRIVFFLAAAMVVPAMYSLARRAASPAGAALGTLVCVAWSVPNYFAGMPSWYVLFLSIGGVWALFRYFDSERGAWLVLAGLCGGLAVVVKITGLYFVAAAALALVYREQNRSGEHGAAEASRSPVMLVLVALLAAGLAACVLMLLRRMWRPSEIVYFAAPTITIAAVLVSHEWNVARGAAWTRLKHWAYQWGLFGLGVAAPVSCFLIPYAYHGGLWELYLGLFVRPEQRFEFGALAMPGLISFGPVVVWALPLALAGRLAGRPRTKAAATLCWSMCLVPCAAVLWACRSQLVFNVIWCSALNAVPAVCIAGCAFLLVSQREPDSGAKRLEQLFLLVLAAQLISLQQFPFALAVYFFYGAPLLVLAGLHLIARLPGRSARVGLCLAAFYLAFAVLWMNPAFNVGFSGGWSPHARLMDSPRCGLCIPEREARLYESVVKLIQQNSSPASSILALPDCPEVYFLANRKNPTRRIYDFLTDATGRGDDILDVLEEQPIPVAVINTRPLHSPPVEPELLRQIQRRYGARTRVNGFVVFWDREPSRQNAPGKGDRSNLCAASSGPFR